MPQQHHAACDDLRNSGGLANAPVDQHSSNPADLTRRLCPIRAPVGRLGPPLAALLQVGGGTCAGKPIHLKNHGTHRPAFRNKYAHVRSQGKGASTLIIMQGTPRSHHVTAALTATSSTIPHSNTTRPTPHAQLARAPIRACLHLLIAGFR